MKTIEELAKECGAYIETGENDEHLEALCKAYMQDRLSELEPLAYNHHFIQDDDFMPEEVLSHNANVPAIIGCKYANKTDVLHDISSLLENK